ncbi:MAG: serine/threonine protein kinase [Gemmataceae bacterium]|nr:serine/threonine protein kinase [Gemmataceae bacterium]MCI0737524.1 serine/threonine protein kinase [Gemmataceae bacterium]
MASPVSASDFIGNVRKSGVVDTVTWDEYLRIHPALPNQPHLLADKLVREQLLTPFQAKHLLAGRHRGLVLGQYRLLDQIGKGGTGVVFLAEHRQLRRRVAIKVLPGEHTRDKETLQRFYREARAVAALDHPHIVQAYDVSNEGHIHYLVMEYVDGESLQTYVEKRGALPIREAAGYILQVARAMQHYHERGLVHRDIKPGNLLRDAQGSIKLTDLGIVRMFEDKEVGLTQQLSRGAVLGTADYLSPEQAVNCHTVDIRSDIYSLGTTFYTLLNGRPPFHDSKITQKLVDCQVREPVPLHQLSPEVPRALSSLVGRMVAKRPEDRPQTPAEVVEAITPWALPYALPIAKVRLPEAQLQNGSAHPDLLKALTFYGVEFKKTIRRHWGAALVAAGLLTCLGVLWLASR